MPPSHQLPRSAADLKAMIAAGVQESVHLDYKGSDSLYLPGNHKDISKDVSAFLNSDGGLLVYGITELDHLPTGVDAGVPHTSFSRERLEQIILSNISPRPSGIEISQIPLSGTHSAYAVGIPKGYSPFQDSRSHRYYKRFNFQSVPMEHYEIEDLRTRRLSIEKLMTVEVEIRHGVLVHLIISNPGTLPAGEVRLSFEPTFPWYDQPPPPFITDGAKALAPGARLHFFYDTYQKLLAPANPRPAAFVVTASYRHPTADTMVVDQFPFDLNDYNRSAVINSEVVDVGKKLEEALKRIQSELHDLHTTVKDLAKIASPTGLALSIPTLRNLASLEAGNPSFQLPHRVSVDVGTLQEALGLDFPMAYRIRDYLWKYGPERIEDIDGITPELVARILQLFPDQPGA